MTTNFWKSFLFTCILLTRSNNQLQNYEFKFQNKFSHFQQVLQALFGYFFAVIHENLELDAVNKLDE